jgi:hypothetical protein
MNLLFEVDMILGDEFMTKYDCILHYGRKCLMIQKGKRHITVKTPPIHRDSPEEPDAVLMCCLPRSSPSVQPGHPASEKSWVSNLIGEFFELFQDPPPDGLPPMQKEVHSIPTEPGHPPPFWLMYLLSPLEYRELEKQVTAFLKTGSLHIPI